jgi:hypothetical protein
MKNLLAVKKTIIGYHALMAGVAAAVVALIAALPNPAYAAQVSVPSVPAAIVIEEGNVPFLVGHATGTQNYICLPSGTGFAYKLFTPQATLVGDNGKQIITHYFSPNLAKDGAIRATWQDKNTNIVWAEVKAGDSSSDPAFVQPGAIPWLKVTQVGAQPGENGNDKLTDTTFIQRINTAGGIAPSTGCAAATDIGNQAFVPYTADYYFYRAAKK